MGGWKGGRGGGWKEAVGAQWVWVCPIRVRIHVWSVWCSPLLAHHVAAVSCHCWCAGVKTRMHHSMTFALQYSSANTVSARLQVWEGKNAVLTGRKMIGATNPQVSIALAALLRQLQHEAISS